MTQPPSTLASPEKAATHAAVIRKALLVGPCRISRLGIKVLLDSIGDVKGYAESDTPLQAFEPARSQSVDLAIFDLYPRYSHWEALLGILKTSPGPARTLALIDAGTPRPVCENLLDNGLDGILQKTSSRTEWRECLSRLLHGKGYLCRIMQATLSPHRLSALEPGLGHPLEHLSQRETQVFQWMGCGRSPSGIARQLELSLKTIETYQSNIKRKLNLANAAELRRAARLWIDKGVIDG